MGLNIFYVFGRIWVDIVDYIFVEQCFCDGTFVLRRFSDISGWNFVCVLTLIFSILTVECISKVSVDNRVNNWLRWIHVNVSGIQSFKDVFYWLVEGVF